MTSPSWNGEGLPGEVGSDGTVLLPMTGSRGTIGLHLYTPDGGAIGSQLAIGNVPFGQPSGFEGVEPSPVSNMPEFRVHQFAPGGGGVTGDWQAGTAYQSLRPVGGLTVLVAETRALQSFDGAAQVRWTLPLPLGDAPLFAFATDALGNTLVLYDGSATFGAGTVGGLWVADDATVGAPFLASATLPSSGSVWLERLNGGGLLLQSSDGSWSAVSPSLAPASEPAPEWLRSLRSPELHPIRGGSAYAVVRRLASPSESCRVEVVTNDGISCGSFDFDVDARGCESVEVGVDGTVVTQARRSSADCDDLHGTCNFTWHWWPGFLR